MRNDVLNGSSATSLTALVGGIVTDIEQLIVQQTQLVRLEIREDLRKARTGALFLGAGLGIVLVGGLLFCLMPAYLLNWATDLPLWACFGIVGAVFLLIGGGAVYAALKKFQDAVTLPDSVTALKENVTCLLRRK
jgi:hypothetical protein